MFQDNLLTSSGARYPRLFDDVRKLFRSMKQRARSWYPKKASVPRAQLVTPVSVTKCKSFLRYLAASKIVPFQGGPCTSSAAKYSRLVTRSGYFLRYQAHSKIALFASSPRVQADTPVSVRTCDVSSQYQPASRTSSAASYPSLFNDVRKVFRGIKQRARPQVVLVTPVFLTTCERFFAVSSSEQDRAIRR